MPKIPRLILVLLPGIVFVLVLTAFLTKIPKTQPATDEKIIVPTIAFTPTPNIKNLTPIQLFTKSLRNLQIKDPQLTPPNYDRKIFLPDEK